LQLHAKSCAAGDREALDVSTRQLHLAEDQIQRWLRDDRMSEPHGPTALADILDAAIQLAQPTAEHLQVALQIERDAQLDAQTTHESGSLQSAVLNLLMNAVQAAGAGGTVRIQTSCLIKDGRAEGQIRVIDDGPGPHVAIATRMFEPFVTTKPEGVGMGLALVERTARKLGGTVGWQRIDERTVFTLNVPVSACVPREADASAIHGCASGEDDESDSDRR
jgi:signal transduction histidine kinase